jgi:hypothetical protein
MFKKSNHSGDKTPKQENKEQELKRAETVNQPAADAKSATAPIDETKKS